MGVLDKILKKDKSEPARNASHSDAGGDKKAEKKEVKKTVEKTVEKKPSGKIKIEDARIYRVLKKPWVTEKATYLVGQNKYVFKVFSDAGKKETKKAIEAIYNVKVSGVNIINIPRKKRKGGKRRQQTGYKPGYKKAIVSLKKGQKIEIMPH